MACQICIERLSDCEAPPESYLILHTAPTILFDFIFTPESLPELGFTIFKSFLRTQCTFAGASTISRLEGQTCGRNIVLSDIKVPSCIAINAWTVNVPLLITKELLCARVGKTLGFLPVLFSHQTTCQARNIVLHAHNCWLPRYHRVTLVPSVQLGADLLASLE